MEKYKNQVNLETFMNEFFTKDEIEALTGTKHPSKQKEWLQQNNYIFDVSYKGDVILLRAHVHEKLSINNKGKNNEI